MTYDLMTHYKNDLILYHEEDVNCTINLFICIVCFCASQNARSLSYANDQTGFWNGIDRDRVLATGSERQKDIR